MQKRIFSLTLVLLTAVTVFGQLPKVYDETINPMAQIDQALQEAKQTNKYVVCQIGGNWCPWCLLFADFIKNNEEVAKVIADNFVYIHVNYPRSNAPAELLQRLGNPARFGFPALVILNEEGGIVHIQDSSFLELQRGYDADKVLRFFRCWTPQAVKGN